MKTLSWRAAPRLLRQTHETDTCSYEGEVLVLLRNSSHNNNTWGLPGGNADEEDGGDLFVTAKREAMEEMQVCSCFHSSGSLSYFAYRCCPS